MAQSVTLFAWAVPAFISELPVDHTWVTTYDNRVNAYPNVQQVAAAGQFYWYCWGSFHAAGGTPINPTGFLGQQTGDLALAQCLVQPNADFRFAGGAGHHLHLWDRWGLPPIGQSGALCDRSRRRSTTDGPQCSRLHCEHLHLRDLWSAARGLGQ